MNRKQSSKRRKYEHEKLRRILSVILMFSLILQGINISAFSVGASQEQNCGRQEHTHDASCYEREQTCTVPEHLHNEACFDEEGSQICALDEHTHGDTCYENILKCGLDEHVHSEECYNTYEEMEMDGGQNSEDEFTDSTDGFTDAGEAVKDIDIVISSDRKYAFAGEDELTFQVDVTGGKDPLSKYYEIYCGQDLVEGNSLDGETITYVPRECGIYTLRVSVTDADGSTVGTEYSIPVAVHETEDPDEWTASVQDVARTGDYANDLVETARSQLGYEESTRNFIIKENGDQKGYTRYGDWYGSPYEDWNALFAGFCLRYADLPSEYSVTGSDSASWKNEHPEFYKDNDGGYTPKAGDLIFFHDSESDTITDTSCPTRMGIIENIDKENGTICTIEGDSEDRVARQNYQLNDKSIVGFIEIPSAADEDQIFYDISTLATNAINATAAADRTEYRPGDRVVQTITVTAPDKMKLVSGGTVTLTMQGGNNGTFTCLTEKADTLTWKADSNTAEVKLSGDFDKSKQLQFCYEYELPGGFDNTHTFGVTVNYRSKDGKTTAAGSASDTVSVLLPDGWTVGSVEGPSGSGSHGDVEKGTEVTCTLNIFNYGTEDVQIADISGVYKNDVLKDLKVTADSLPLNVPARGTAKLVLHMVTPDEEDLWGAVPATITLTDAQGTSQESAVTIPLIPDPDKNLWIIPKGTGKQDGNGYKFEVQIDNWSGNASDNDSMTGVLEKYVNGRWERAASIDNVNKGKFKYSVSVTDADELLNVPYRFKITENNSKNTEYYPNALSEEFYLADFLKEGFRKWALDVYPNIYNSGDQIQNMAELKDAFAIYNDDNRKIMLNIEPEESEYIAGDMAMFNIAFRSTDDLKKDKTVQISLKGNNDVDITDSSEVSLASSGLSEYISLESASNGMITMKILKDIQKNTEVSLLYTFKINEAAELGEHTLYGQISCENRTGEDLGKYTVAQPTSGWLIRKAELQNAGEILPKRDDRTGTEVTYKLTVENYGDSDRTLRKLTAKWSGGMLSDELMKGTVLPAAAVTKNADGTETRIPGTLDLTCSFEAPLSYESVENITFTATDSLRTSKTITSRLNLKQDGKYWLVTGDSTVTVDIDESDQAVFGTVSASVTDNLDERTGADVAINGKIQYWDESSGTWKTVTRNLSSPTTGTFSKVNVGSGFTAVFNTTYLTVDELLNTRYRFIANAANQSAKKNEDKITYSDNDNASDINASQPFYLADKLEKSGFRNWVLNPENGYDTTSMSQNDLAEAYKKYSRIGLNVDVAPAEDEYEAGFDATLNVAVSADSTLNMNGEIRLKLSDITENMTAAGKITFPDDLKVEEETDYSRKITVENGEIIIQMGKSLPQGSPVRLKVTAALEFADETGDHKISAYAVYRENGAVKLEDTDTGILKVVSPGGWHIISVEGPAQAVYPGDDVDYTVTLRNFENDPVTFKTEDIRVLFGQEKTELEISEYQDADGNRLTGDITLNGNDTIKVTVKIKAPVGSEATGTRPLQFRVTDTEKTTETKETDITFARAELTIEPAVIYDTATGAYTVKLVCKDLYGSEIDLHDLTWESRDTETSGDWKSIGTQKITPIGSGKNIQYVDSAEFILTGENLKALEAKKDSGEILYRLKDTVSGQDYYSHPIYFDDLQDMKDAAKLMVELAKALGYDYDEFTTILDYLYYDEVAKDSKVPFSDRNSLTQFLLQEYRAGGNNIDSAVKAWKKYYTDMMDPNMSLRSTDHGSDQTLPTTKPQKYDWEDENLQYDKDESKTASNPFHNVIRSVIKGMKDFMQDGGLFSGSYFSGLSKTAAADEPGDENKERNYTIDIKANADGTYSVPTVVVFQIQTSWQMFDLDHANQKNGPKGSPCTVTDMATLYDIKHAMIDFAEYMKEHGDGSVCFAVTDVEHAGTFSMIGAPYFTNDMDNLISGLEQWDIFGNCEHVHYTSEAYTDAVESITSGNFSNWKDGNGNSIFANAKKVSVIVGGSTENSNGKDGYGCVVPDVGSSYLDYLYTIRCNSGTASPYLSWLDNAGMTNLVKKYNGIAFKDVTTREQLVSVFKSILQDVGKLGNIQAAKDVVLEDTIENEFSLSEAKDAVQLITYDFNGNPTATTIRKDDKNLKIIENSDGTTTIRYNAGSVEYGGTVHLRFKVHAKENYIGSNNVRTNVDVPTLEYVNDIYGSAKAQMKFTDKPEVNVPIRYNIEDGGEKEVTVNTEVDLWNDLDAEKIVGATGEQDGIENWASGSGGNYGQINGTVTYQWEIEKLDENGDPVLDDDGNPVYETIGESASVHVTGGKPDAEYPDLKTRFTPDRTGEYKFRLKTVFTPDDKSEDWSGKNDDPVSPSVKYGYVTVKAKDSAEPATVRVIKNIDNYDQLAEGFGDTKFKVTVTKADGTSVVSKDLTSYTQHKEDTNIALKELSISEKTELVFSELTQDDRALKFEFKALNIKITDRNGNQKSDQHYTAGQYSLNDRGELTDADGNTVTVSVDPGDVMEAEFVNTFLTAPVPTGATAGDCMKWALAVIVILSLTGGGFVMRKRRKEGR